MKLWTLPALFALAGLLADAECWSAEVQQQAVTVLFGDQAVGVDRALVDGDELWVAAADVPSINGFEPKPEGFCAGEICVPIPGDWSRTAGDTEYFCVTRFAEKVDQAVATDAAHSTWSFGRVPLLQGGGLPSGVAPDFALPDREGNLVRLSDFRGKKVLLLTWASW